MSDVRLFHTPDGGEIEYRSGRAVMADGLETAAYLSLFGGNEEDDGSGATESLQWWGNFGETDPARRYRSETQALLRALPATTANLRRVESAVGRDLDWMTESLATSISAEATMPGLNRIAITITLEVDGTIYEFEFEESWSSTL